MDAAPTIARERPPFSEPAVAFGLAALVAALSLSAGTFDMGSFVLLAVAVLLVGLAAAGVLRRAPLGRPAAIATVVIVAASGLGVTRSAAGTWVAVPLLAVLVASTLAALTVGRRRPFWLFTAIAVAALGVLLGSLWRWGSDPIDVFWYVQGGATSLLHGQDPYAVTYPTLVSTPDWRLVIVQEPVSYFPMALLLAVPGRLAGDVRLMSLVAELVTIGLIVRAIWSDPATPPWRRRLLTLLTCVLPLWVPMIIGAWTDAGMMAAFTVWLTFRRSHPRVATLALGIALADKATVLLLVLPFVIWSRRSRVQASYAAAFAFIVTLPFAAVAGFDRFLAAVAGDLIATHPRPDGLELDALLHSLGAPALPPLVLPVVLALGIVVVAQHRPWTEAHLLLAAAMLSAATFLFAGQAFLNYYFDTAICLLAVLAWGSRPLDEEDVALPLAQLRWRRFTSGRVTVGETWGRDTAAAPALGRDR